MKKKLGVLILSLSSLVISAACASSSGSSKPPQPDTGHDDTSGELNGNGAKAAAPALAIRLANAPAVQAKTLASR
jgi:hypothetical protein